MSTITEPSECRICGREFDNGPNTSKFDRPASFYFERNRKVGRCRTCLSEMLARCESQPFTHEAVSS